MRCKSWLSSKAHLRLAGKLAVDEADVVTDLRFGQPGMRHHI